MRNSQSTADDLDLEGQPVGTCEPVGPAPAALQGRSLDRSALHVRRVVARIDSARSRRVLLTLTLIAIVIVVTPTAMSLVARLCLAVFAVMLGVTAFTKVNEVAICSATLAALVLVGGSSVSDVTGTATGSTVWLLVGAFVVAAAANRSGVAERLAFAVGRRAKTVDGLLVRITFVLIATAFIVPSTSGRAALMLPVYLAFAEQIEDRRVRRALAVLFPSAILLSAVASLFGAGAHLVTVELAAASGGASLGFLEWAVYGLPFAVASSFIALLVVRATFLDRSSRELPIHLDRESTRWSRQERIVTIVLGALVVTWLTESLHSVPAWAAALIGAIVVTIGPLRVVSMGQARSALPLDLLFIMIATAEAGAALARSGAADWIASTLLSPVVGGGSPTVAIVLVVGLVSLLAHLVITSRTARASVLIPVVVLVAGASGLDVTALAFLSTTAAGYCLSTTTSAKPIRVFSKTDDGYDEDDLRRLSLRLLPLHVALLLGFAFFVWPMLGLALERDRPTEVGGDRAYPWEPMVIDELDVGPRLGRSPVEVDADAERVELPPTAPKSDDSPALRFPAGNEVEGGSNDIDAPDRALDDRDGAVDANDVVDIDRAELDDAADQRGATSGPDDDGELGVDEVPDVEGEPGELGVDEVPDVEGESDVDGELGVDVPALAVLPTPGPPGPSAPGPGNDRDDAAEPDDGDD